MDGKFVAEAGSLPGRPVCRSLLPLALLDKSATAHMDFAKNSMMCACFKDHRALPAGEFGQPTLLQQPWLRSERRAQMSLPVKSQLTLHCTLCNLQQLGLPSSEERIQIFDWTLAVAQVQVPAGPQVEVLHQQWPNGYRNNTMLFLS